MNKAELQEEIKFFNADLILTVINTIINIVLSIWCLSKLLPFAIGGSNTIEKTPTSSDAGNQMLTVFSWMGVVVIVAIVIFDIFISIKVNKQIRAIKCLAFEEAEKGFDEEKSKEFLKKSIITEPGWFYTIVGSFFCGPLVLIGEILKKMSLDRIAGYMEYAH